MFNITRQRLRQIIVTLTLALVLLIVNIVWAIHGEAFNNGYLLSSGIYIPKIDNIEYYLLYCSLALVAILMYCLLVYIKFVHIEQEWYKEKLANEFSQNTINLLRSHRHDFLNHLQVVLGYIQLGKSQKAEEYIKSINNELQKIHIIGKIHASDIAVLLYTKKEEALRNNINLNFNILTNLSNLKIKEIDLVRIVSNLVDNAFYEVKNNTTDQKRIVEISFEEINNVLSITISNSGSYIEDVEKIFEYGFTTKGTKGTGIGLFNVKKLVEKYNGKIHVYSNKSDGTTFNIELLGR